LIKANNKDGRNEWTTTRLHTHIEYGGATENVKKIKQFEGIRITLEEMRTQYEERR